MAPGFCAAPTTARSGGLTGPALALALAQAGCSVTVIDALSQQGLAGGDLSQHLDHAELRVLHLRQGLAEQHALLDPFTGFLRVSVFVSLKVSHDELRFLLKLS